MKLLLCSLLFVFSVNHSFTQRTVTYNCFFSINSAVWPKDSIDKLSLWITPYLENKSNLKITLTAFSDTTGRKTSNLKLAELRLRNVENYFKDNNIAIYQSSALGENFNVDGYTTHESYRKVMVTIEYTDVESIITQKQEVLVKKPKVDPLKEERIKKRVEDFNRAESVVQLKILFIGDKATYLDGDNTEVWALYEYMVVHPELKALIRGHVCCSNNLALSKARAKMVYKDLIKKGISPERLTYDGFGNSIPLQKEKDEASMQANRRVDVVFSKK